MIEEIQIALSFMLYFLKGQWVDIFIAIVLIIAVIGYVFYKEKAE